MTVLYQPKLLGFAKRAYCEASGGSPELPETPVAVFGEFMEAEGIHSQFKKPEYIQMMFDEKSLVEQIDTLNPGPRQAIYANALMLLRETIESGAELGGSNEFKAPESGMKLKPPRNP